MTAFEQHSENQIKPAAIDTQPWRYFHALALDYDGTLTDGGRPGEELLNALREQREEGRKLLLVTGRILTELRHEFFDIQEWFDIIVAENGAVILRGDVSHTLAPPLTRELDRALHQRRDDVRSIAQRVIETDQQALS